MKILPEQMRLYAVTDRTWLHGRNLIDVVSEAIDGGATFVQLREKSHLESLDGGVTMLQLREKTLEEGAFLEEARALQALCRERHVPFIVNDNVDIARAMGADGVHVGQEDMAAKKARALLGPDKILGVSAHNPEEARKAQEDGADYLGCGAAFVTGTKLDAKPITAEMMKAVTESVEIPVVAIGGITEDNIPKLTGRGLAGAAVVSAIFAAEDPRKASERLLEKIRQWE